MEPTPDANTSLDNREFTCPYCRLKGTVTKDVSCPHCGAPVDIRARVSDSGWVEQPPVRDMARIQFGRSTCQIEGTCVPVVDMGLEGNNMPMWSV